ncbi:hypothetical protein [Actinacidiphila sp. ITFR-21]|uniref:hypothetical protein n=1 Tax=Actinacidiphila sp. ITFR-21 TaxID=3075199 RepID=UPI002889A4FC|nr:hypothetical protein [Streptomyces sp. ITFR-21]WNI14349.1 hypothetical protein RLT57_01560 [Streptomyces sp. ITFR-21]
MIRTRIAAAVAATALAVAGSILATGSTAAAAPTATYQCPQYITGYGQTWGLSGWVTGVGKLGCTYGYGGNAYFCVYSAYNGAPVADRPNPEYCPAHAVQTA